MNKKINIINIITDALIMIIAIIYIVLNKSITQKDIFNILVGILLLVYPLCHIIFLTIKETVIKNIEASKLNLILPMAYIILGGGVLQFSYYVNINIIYYYIITIVLVYLLTYILKAINDKNNRKK